VAVTPAEPGWYWALTGDGDDVRWEAVLLYKAGYGDGFVMMAKSAYRQRTYTASDPYFREWGPHIEPPKEWP
jgi:hypothetical protein